MFIKAYWVNIDVNIKPIYLNMHYLFENDIYCLDEICASCFVCLLTVIKKHYNILLLRKCSLKFDSKKTEFQNLISNDKIFKENAQIVKIYVVKFNVTSSNRLKIMGFFEEKVNTHK